MFKSILSDFQLCWFQKAFLVLICLNTIIKVLAVDLVLLASKEQELTTNR